MSESWPFVTFRCLDLRNLTTEIKRKIKGQLPLLGKDMHYSISRKMYIVELEIDSKMEFGERISTWGSTYVGNVEHRIIRFGQI